MSRVAFSKILGCCGTPRTRHCYQIDTLTIFAMWLCLRRRTQVLKHVEQQKSLDGIKGPLIWQRALGLSALSCQASIGYLFCYALCFKALRHWRISWTLHAMHFQFPSCSSAPCLRSPLAGPLSEHLWRRPRWCQKPHMVFQYSQHFH